MKIAVVGATGRIGAKITKNLLQAGHSVRALSRGGPALDALTRDGAEPFVGSFETGTGELNRFFEDADAAFLMCKTDWNNLHGHYSEVALRMFDALRDSPVRFAVNLTAMGSDVRGSTGHFQPFYQYDQILNRLSKIDLVHLQAGYFMEALSSWTSAVAQHGRIAWSLHEDVKSPWIAIEDVARLATAEFTRPSGEHRALRQLGTDLTMPQIAAAISYVIDRPVEYRFVDMTRMDLQAEFLKRFGTLERWVDDKQTLDAVNDGRIRFTRNRLSLDTKLESFLRDVWKPKYLDALGKQQVPETFLSWTAGLEA